MLKYIKKIVVIISIICLMSCILQNISNADGSFSEIMKDKVMETEDWEDNSNVEPKVDKILSTIIVAVRVIGVCVAVTMLLVLAMKYMTSAPSDRAEIKKSAIVYVVGAFVLFAVTGLLGVLADFAEIIKPTATGNPT